MKAVINCMQRVEKKYLLTHKQYQELMRRINGYICKDEFFQSSIKNIYFDMDNYEMITHSIEKPLYKEKIRLRSYHNASDNDDVFLEVKKKCKGVVNKRRVMIKYKDFNGFINGDDDNQISNELKYLFKFYHPQLKVFIAYDRLSYQGKDDHNLRITFDSNIRSRFNDLSLHDHKNDKLLFTNNEILMEIKVNNAIPLWLVRILSDLQIYPTSFSKYGRIFIESKKEENICLQVL